MRFDPWGKPLTPLGARAGSGDRGFTGHEHLAGGLIHMNGRIYDPVLGRFLSADIVVQAPNVITSYNRYGYVMNNPLAMTDPSGYFFVIDDLIFAAFLSMGVQSGFAALATYATIGAGVAAATGHTTAARRFAAAAIMFLTAGIGGEYAAMWRVGGAFAAGGLQSGSIDGAVLAAMSAGVFSAAGEISDLLAVGDPSVGLAPDSAFNVGGLGRAGMHFGAAALTAMMAGADPIRQGFSAGFAEMAGPYISGTDVGIKQFAAHVVAGGVGEVIAGGKFANGAMTGAFAWLYNHARVLTGKGHHFVTNQTARDLGFSPAALEVFDSVEGRLNVNHRWDKEHAEYNKAVRTEIDKIIKEGDGIDPKKATAEQAKKILERIKTSEVPAIKNFNLKLYMRGIMQGLRRGGFRGGGSEE